MISGERFLVSQALNVVSIFVNETSKLLPYIVSSIKLGIVVSCLSS